MTSVMLVSSLPMATGPKNSESWKLLRAISDEAVSDQQRSQTWDVITSILDLIALANLVNLGRHWDGRMLELNAESRVSQQWSKVDSTYCWAAMAMPTTASSVRVTDCMVRVILGYAIPFVLCYSQTNMHVLFKFLPIGLGVVRGYG